MLLWSYLGIGYWSIITDYNAHRNHLMHDVDTEYNDALTDLIEVELKKIHVSAYQSPRTRLLLEELSEYIIVKLYKSFTANPLEADDMELS